MALDDLQGQLDGVGDDLNALSDTVGMQQGTDTSGLSDGLGDLQADVATIDDVLGDIESRLSDLEPGQPTSCSLDPSPGCIPDGIDLVETGLDELVTEACRIEVGCCDADELRLKFGGGITTVGECKAAFVDMVENGYSPGFLDGEGLMAVRYAVALVQLLNSTDIRVELDADAIAACVDELSLRNCVADAVGEGRRCTPRDYGAAGPCGGEGMLRGLRSEGEVCSRTAGFAIGTVDDCGEGLVCRAPGELVDGEVQVGLCVPPAQPGEACIEDYHCDSGEDLYCHAPTNRCRKRGQAGDDCAYIDPTFLDIDAVDEFFDGGDQSRALVEQCSLGFSCDPNTLKCAQNCSEGALCYVNDDCPEDKVCNRTMNPDFTQRTEGAGVCTDPIANLQPCRVQNAFENNLHGPSECESGRCMDDPSTEPIDPKCAPALPAGAACANVTASVNSMGAWQCEGLFCGSDNTCAEHCVREYNYDLARYESLIQCPADHYCGMTEIWPLIDEDQSVHACLPTIASDLACDWNVDEVQDPTCQSGFCFYGTCLDVAAAGGSCPTMADAQCPDTQFCKPDTVATCTDRLGLDGDCGDRYNKVTPTYGEDAQCQEGFRCAHTGEYVFQCKPMGDSVGAACVYGGFVVECGEGLYCSSTTNTCQARLGVGDACVAATATALGSVPACDEGLGCNVEGTDECQAPGTAGMACQYAAPLPCEPGLSCFPNPAAVSRCYPDDAAADGSYCEGDGQCQSAWCRDGLCTARVADGGACDFGGDGFPDRCLPDSYCDHAYGESAGLCKPQKTAGQPCVLYMEGTDCWAPDGGAGYCVRVHDQYLCSDGSVPGGAFCDGG